MVLVHGILLHGRIEVCIEEAEELWVEESRSTREKIARAVTMHSVLNPYVVVSLEHLPKPPKRIVKTRCAYNTDRPKWDHVQSVDVATVVSYVTVTVRSSSTPEQRKDWLRHKGLGTVRIKAERVLWGVVDGWMPLAGLTGKPGIISTDPKNRGRIKLRIRYHPVDSLAQSPSTAVPGTYFKATPKCHVQLFQDAHCPSGSVIEIPGSSDNLYGTPRRAPGDMRVRKRLYNYFEEIYNAIQNAQKMIYIAGWSVDTTLELLRRTKEDREAGATKPPTLGELLKRKADEGVCVLLLVWDEVLSTNKLVFRSQGLMNTRDEVTKAFFKDTRVKAAVVPRIGRAGQLVKAPLVPTLFTFHEKMVVADIAAYDLPKTTDVIGPRTRQLAAFVGGLDLTYGRWDTPSHSLFSTLEGEHADDFHNAMFQVTKSHGPREPWHDTAAMITGPVVRDIVCCFEERWRRQGLGTSHLYDLDGDKNMVDGSLNHAESWTCQVFRSIDERSSVFGRETVRRLETKKGRYIDRSIHHAYVHYARAAKRFIYIEQQYFIGSSDQWLQNSHKDATNIIPQELALRIARSIQTGNYLRVYVVLPMWPEGIATDQSVQQILFFQYRTVEMMMKTIADAISEANLEDAHPTDFLGIFCLGAREAPETPQPPSAPSTENSDPDTSDHTNSPPQQSQTSPLPPPPPPPTHPLPPPPMSILKSIPTSFPIMPQSQQNRKLQSPPPQTSLPGRLPMVNTSPPGRPPVPHASPPGRPPRPHPSPPEQFPPTRLSPPQRQPLTIIRPLGQPLLEDHSTHSNLSSASVSSRSSVGSRASRFSARMYSRLSSSFGGAKPQTTDEDVLAHSRRAPIYQHAKLMIVDDEIVVCGSSNINERSMSGFRDTELAVGMYQPEHVYSEEEGTLPNGEVARFRKRLWAEHAVGPDATDFPDVLDDPGSLECMRELRQRAEANWILYRDTKPTTMITHILPYPYTVAKDGRMGTRTRMFPDTRALVCGIPSKIIPNILAS